MTFRLAILASGRGSNLQALLDAANTLDAEIVGVFSDKPASRALTRAREARVPAVTVTPHDFATRAAYDEHLFSRIDAVQPDLIVCAGYMRLIGDKQVEAQRGRMINIHPSLLPAFKGLHTHQQALAAGVNVHGASVHFVTSELDSGAVISQARVPVMKDDDAMQLSQRVLAREHRLLVETVRLFVQYRIELVESHVYLDGTRLPQPLALNPDNQLRLS